MKCRRLGFWLLACAGLASPAIAAPPHNLILFVPDGLRAAIVDASTAPTMARLRAQGADFNNSHSLFPTFTTANASAFATGHGLSDTGDFSNSIYTGIAIQGTVTPFLENDSVQRDLNAALDGNYLDEPSLIAAAAAGATTGKLQFSTAVIGKLGPVAVFNPAALAGTDTLIIDDSTGQAGNDIGISAAWRQVIADAHIKPIDAPPRGDNSVSGTFIPNLAQQQYFLEMTLKVVLPQFKQRGKPFVLVYWTRDPDGSQHTQGDGDINGPTSMSAIRLADGALAAIEQQLKALNLYDTTNIIVAADHGFSTITKESDGRMLPTGFLALDLAAALAKIDPTLHLFDPDQKNQPVDPQQPKLSKGDAVIGRDPQSPQVVVAANGGSDLIYLPELGAERPSQPRRIRALGKRIVALLLEQDYVSGLFVNDRMLGKLPGTLPMSAIGLMEAARTPVPAIVVNFRSQVASPCDKLEPLLCTREIADTIYPGGGGMHGSFSRADTWNFMAARGPDFREHFQDSLPASNADIGMTIAEMLGLQLTPKGKLSGRILTESLRSNADEPLPQVEHHMEVSDPSAQGLSTRLQVQSVDGHRYFDAAGFAGRTAGLGP
jgi:Type I phosphodiesterase / nucleotide pyrophosphatase